MILLFPVVPVLFQHGCRNQFSNTTLCGMITLAAKHSFSSKYGAKHHGCHTLWRVRFFYTPQTLIFHLFPNRPQPGRLQIHLAPAADFGLGRGAARSRGARAAAEFAPTCRFRGCGEAFLSREQLREHVALRHPAASREFVCDECGQAFTSAQGMKFHMSKHTGESRFILDSSCLSAVNRCMKLLNPHPTCGVRPGRIIRFPRKWPEISVAPNR